MNVEGSAAVTCLYAGGQALTNCEAISETPSGYSFGQAAVQMLESGAVKPNPRVQVGERFETRIRFRLAS